MAVIDASQSEILSLAHVENALALSIEAGWNQTPDDWAFFTEHGRTRGIFIDGELVATAATLTYGSLLGYVSMILVTPRFCNRGIANKLLRESVDDLEVRGYRALLDATPARRGGLSAPRVSVAALAGRRVLRAARRTATLPNVEHLIGQDALAFGADRPFLIRNLLARAGNASLAIWFWQMPTKSGEGIATVTV
jgi:hypothetical protein